MFFFVLSLFLYNSSDFIFLNFSNLSIKSFSSLFTNKIPFLGNISFGPLGQSLEIILTLLKAASINTKTRILP